MSDRYELLFRQSPVGLLQYDRRLVIHECNDSLVRILRTRRELLVGLDMHRLRDQRVLPALDKALAGEEGYYEGPYRATTSDAEIWVEMRTVPFTSAAGEVAGGIGIVEDVTARKEAEAVQSAVYEIAQAVHRTQDLDALCRSIHGILGRLMPADNVYLALYDAATDTVSFPYFVDQNDPPPGPQKARAGLTEHVLKTGRPLLADTARLEAMAAAGEVRLAGSMPASWLGVPLRSQAGTHGVLVLQSYDPQVPFTERDRDVLAFVGDQVAMAIERKRREAQIEQMAYYDGLTGLENRRMLQERAAHGLAMAERKSWRTALLYLDLDRFKNVNDTLGHEAGDELLAHIAHALRGCLRKSDALARLGGDEFAVLLDDVQPEQAATTAQRILECLDRPFEVHDQRVHVGGSIGIALYPDHGKSLDELLKHADIAMYRIKDAGGGFTFYDSVKSPYSRRRLEIEAELREAVAAGALDLAFQPILDLATGAVAGVETLVRWPRGDEVLAASEFVPVAEESDLIRRVDAFALAAALARAGDWQAARPGFEISVNVSARSLHSADLVERVGERLAATGVDPGTLVLEVTESAAIRDPRHSRRVLAALRDLGVHLAIDDFGSGYASLTYLRLLPFDRVKIDRSLVREIGRDARGERLLRAAIELGHSLDLGVVGEGVEREEQLAWLRAEGCDRAQGFLVGRPQPFADALAALGAPVESRRE